MKPFSNPIVNMDESEIVNFYKNRSVFLTGVTGFLGKAILEKLLRSCPEIGNIYVLLRPKRNLNVEERLQKILQSTLFDTLRTTNCSVLTKVVPILGDLSLPELGITSTDQLLLQDVVTVVINSAATVNFGEKLKVTIEINVIGVQKLIHFCKQIKNLQALVHVSTAFANSEKRILDETVHPVTVQPDNLIKALDWMSDEVVQHMVPMLLNRKGNTYTFSKSLAEYLLSKEDESLPIAIVRPSIVGATWHEPIPGWVDNFNGASGIIAGYSKGILHTAKAGKTKVAHFIPIDFAVNLVIVAACEVATSKKSKQLQVYNCCTGKINPVLWGQVIRHVFNSIKEIPIPGSIWYPFMLTTTNVTYYKVLNFFFHYLPAQIMDAVAIVTKKSPRMRDTYQFQFNATEMFSPFTTRDWIVQTENTTELYYKMSDYDKQLFNFNCNEINWETYFHNYCLGIREHLLKETTESIPDARKKFNRLWLIHHVFFMCLVGIIVGFFAMLFRWLR